MVITQRANTHKISRSTIDYIFIIYMGYFSLSRVFPINKVGGSLTIIRMINILSQTLFRSCVMHERILFSATFACY
ncbi:hypothetical protein H8356DRAFT_1333143 [Neocallimastix lanati (nom. inval.)]|nr:hypothetical protein H8356DRAFT_1333143 [Neocallimastix sp. JGI-2020a]